MIIKTAYNMKPPVSARLIPGHPINRGLIGCWLMNEGSGIQVYDSTGYGHKAYVTGATWDRSRLLWDATTDKIVCQGDSIWKNNIEGSVIVKHTRTAAWDTYGGLLRVENSSSNSPREMRLYTQNTGYLRFVPDVDLGVYWNFGDETVIFPLNQPAVIAAVWKDGIKLCGYVDGKEYGNNYGGVSWSGAEFVNNEQVYVGKTGEAAYAIRGYIDYVLMYDRALSTSEIISLYINPFQGIERRGRAELIFVAAGGDVGGAMLQMDHFAGGVMVA